jgi:hypothetical protein
LKSERARGAVGIGMMKGLYERELKLIESNMIVGLRVEFGRKMYTDYEIMCRVRFLCVVPPSSSFFFSFPLRFIVINHEWKMEETI